jgi:agmatinase
MSLSEIPPALSSYRWAALDHFLKLEPGRRAWDDAGVVILPIPYEATTSWGAGTREGPEAILRASRYIELYDEELDYEPADAGVCTLPAIRLSKAGPERAIGELRALYADLLEEAGDRLVIGLGGEHSISSAPTAAWADRLGGGLSILQFDAHSDLRDEYHGTPWNHACAMRRALEHADRVVAVGIRALTSEERELIRRTPVTTIFAHEMRGAGWVDRALQALGQDVYITFDIDFFDPALVPATGTPEPGGGDWWDALDLLAAVFRERRVVGADVVELAPRPGQEASDFVAAKLVYKMIGYWVERAARGGPR